MGSSISKSKNVDYQSKQQIPSDFSCSTTSSERTIVQEQESPSSTKTATLFSDKNKPSILPYNNFFDNIRNKKKAPHYATNINNTSLTRRRKPKYHKKKAAVAVTKSIIGIPTNFKHLNLSTTQFSHVQFLQDNDDEVAIVAAQMIVLSALIKPLPTEEDNKQMTSIIPPRASSYGNSVYVKEFPTIPVCSTTIAIPSIKKHEKKIVGMKNGSIPRSSIARRRAQNHIRAAAKKI